MVSSYVPGVNLLSEVLPYGAPTQDSLRAPFDLFALLTALMLGLLASVMFSVEFEELQAAQARWASNATESWLLSTVGIPDHSQARNPYYHIAALETCHHTGDDSCLTNDDVEAASPPLDELPGKFERCHALHGGSGCSGEPGCCILIHGTIAWRHANQVYMYFGRAFAQLSLALFVALLSRIYIELGRPHAITTYWMRVVVVFDGVLIAIGTQAAFESVDSMKFVKGVLIADPTSRFRDFEWSMSKLQGYVVWGTIAFGASLCVVVSIKNYALRASMIRVWRSMPESLDVPAFKEWSEVQVAEMVRNADPDSLFKDVAEYSENFKRFKVDGKGLAHLNTEKKLKEIGIPVAHRTILLNAINRFSEFTWQLDSFASSRDLRSPPNKSVPSAGCW